MKERGRESLLSYKLSKKYHNEKISEQDRRQKEQRITNEFLDKFVSKSQKKNKKQTIKEQTINVENTAEFNTFIESMKIFLKCFSNGNNFASEMMKAIENNKNITEKILPKIFCKDDYDELNGIIKRMNEPYSDWKDWNRSVGHFHTFLLRKIFGSRNNSISFNNVYGELFYGNNDGSYNKFIEKCGIDKKTDIDILKKVLDAIHKDLDKGYRCCGALNDFVEYYTTEMKILNEFKQDIKPNNEIKSFATITNQEELQQTIKEMKFIFNTFLSCIENRENFLISIKNNMKKEVGKFEYFSLDDFINYNDECMQFIKNNKKHYPKGCVSSNSGNQIANKINYFLLKKCFSNEFTNNKIKFDCIDYKTYGSSFDEEKHLSNIQDFIKKVDNYKTVDNAISIINNLSSVFQINYEDNNNGKKNIITKEINFDPIAEICHYYCRSNPNNENKDELKNINDNISFIDENNISSNTYKNEIDLYIQSQKYYQLYDNFLRIPIRQIDREIGNYYYICPIMEKYIFLKKGNYLDEYLEKLNLNKDTQQYSDLLNTIKQMDNELKKIKDNNELDWKKKDNIIKDICQKYINEENNRVVFNQYKKLFEEIKEINKKYLELEKKSEYYHHLHDKLMVGFKLQRQNRENKQKQEKLETPETIVKEYEKRKKIIDQKEKSNILGSIIKSMNKTKKFKSK